MDMNRKRCRCSVGRNVMFPLDPTLSQSRVLMNALLSMESSSSHAIHSLSEIYTLLWWRGQWLLLNMIWFVPDAPSLEPNGDSCRAQLLFESIHCFYEDLRRVPVICKKYLNYHRECRLRMNGCGYAICSPSDLLNGIGVFLADERDPVQLACNCANDLAKYNIRINSVCKNNWNTLIVKERGRTKDIPMMNGNPALVIRALSEIYYWHHLLRLWMHSQDSSFRWRPRRQQL